MKSDFHQKKIYQEHDYSHVFAIPDKPRSNIRNQRIAHLNYVRRLIKAKHYNKARYELMRLNHPKTDEWLMKLNELDPNYSETTVILLKPLLFVLIIIFAGMVSMAGAGMMDIKVALSISGLFLIIYLVLLSVWSRQKWG